MADLEPLWIRQRRFIFRTCSAFGLSRADRLDVATCVLDRNVDTFRALSPHEISRLADAFSGAAFVARLLMERRAAKRG